jgi:hypothetical protein
MSLLTGLPLGANRSYGRLFTFEKILQYNRAIVFFIPSGVNESDDALFGFSSKHRYLFRIVSQFLSIPALKLVPFRHVVRIPLSKFRAGGNVFQPEIDLGPCLSQPARPEPFDQDALAVSG